MRCGRDLQRNVAAARLPYLCSTPAWPAAAAGTDSSGRQRIRVHRVPKAIPSSEIELLLTLHIDDAKGEKSRLRKAPSPGSPRILPSSATTLPRKIVETGQPVTAIPS